MANDLKDLLKDSKSIRENMVKMVEDYVKLGFKKTEVISMLAKEDTEYKKQLGKLKQINAQIAIQKANQKIIVDDLAAAERNASGLSGIYTNLGKLEQKRLGLQRQMKDIDPQRAAGLNKIASLNQDLAKLDADDVVQRDIILKQIGEQFGSLGKLSTEEKEVAKVLVQQRDAAKKLASLTEGQKEQLDAQVKAYEKIKKTVSGVFDTLSILTSGPMGALGVGLMGAGKAADVIGKNIRSFGGYVDSAQISSMALGLVFKDAEQVTKSLSKEFGGLKDISFSTQLNTNLMAINMGVSGEEAASIVGNFARMNNMSADTAMDMAATTKSMAKAAGVPVDSVMKDVAHSTKAFAEYGKDGGKNIAQAAVSAAKLGVNMDSLTKVTDSLLDFETSINKEMELGAMLGRNINLDRARALAYEGNIGGAVKETLQSLGGIDAFNKMDIFQKRKAAELLNLSVEEFQKMATNSDKLNDDGTIQQSQWSSIWESITGAATASGGFLKSAGGLVLAAAQMGGSFAQMGLDVKGMASKVPLIGKLFKGKTPAEATTPDVTKTTAPQAEGANKFGKINATEMIKGAAAILILAAALWVAAKAFQEFATVKWEDVGKGLVGLLGLAGIAYILSKVAGDMIEGAIAVAILGAALVPFAFALNMMANVNMDAVLAAAAGLVIFSAAVFGLGALMMSGVGAVVFGAGILALLALGGAMIVLGAGLVLAGAGFNAISGALPTIVQQIGSLTEIDFSSLAGLAAALLPLALLAVPIMILGAGLAMAGVGFTAISGVLPNVVEGLSALSQINFSPIFGLAASLMALSVALAAVAVSGLMALPVLAILGGIGLLAGAVGGGTEGGKDQKMDDLINEVKALRADMAAGKIAVHMDGAKVTAGVSRVVDRIGSNSYAKV
jgi:hypothetical protein